MPMYISDLITLSLGYWDISCFKCWCYTICCLEEPVRKQKAAEFELLALWRKQSRSRWVTGTWETPTTSLLWLWLMFWARLHISSSMPVDERFWERKSTLKFVTMCWIGCPWVTFWRVCLLCQWISCWPKQEQQLFTNWKQRELWQWVKLLLGLLWAGDWVSGLYYPIDFLLL